MKTILMLIMMPLMILTACKERNHVSCDINLSYGICNCKCLSLTTLQQVASSKCKWPNGAPFSKGRYPLERCDYLKGFFVKDYAENIKPYFKKVREEILDLREEANHCRPIDL